MANLMLKHHKNLNGKCEKMGNLIANISQESAKVVTKTFVFERSHKNVFKFERMANLTANI